jgi:hypothetical protein
MIPLRDPGHRRFSFTTDLLPPNNNPFEDRDHVRITRVYIVLCGAQQSLRFKKECPNTLLTVKLRLHYTGEFYDLSTNARFVTESFSDDIEFNLDCHGIIREDNSPTYGFERFYPGVGPFDIEVLTPQDQLDLTGVTSVGLKWLIEEFTRHSSTSR